MDKKPIYYIFSDECGSWHDEGEIYLRAWVVITKVEYDKLKKIILEINKRLRSIELKWSTLANSSNKQIFQELNSFDYRIFVTLSSPKDINWNKKYKIMKKFDKSIEDFEFGDIKPELQATIRKKIYDDIKNVLFLNYYEKYHIENASKRIEQIIAPKDYILIYRIDPPQMSKKGWEDILRTISDKELNFPKSHADEGIQFADIIAGCFKSLLIKDEKFEYAKPFFISIKDKFIPKSKLIPNPNLIFYDEINDSLKAHVKEMWSYKN